jgi:hypothetical protein
VSVPAITETAGVGGGKSAPRWTENDLEKRRTTDTTKVKLAGQLKRETIGLDRGTIADGNSTRSGQLSESVSMMRFSTIAGTDTFSSADSDHIRQGWCWGGAPIGAVDSGVVSALEPLS